VTTNAVAAPAPAPPAPRPDDLPIAFLVDYDGTIARTDVGDRVMAAFVNREWEAHAAAFDAGLTGSRELIEWEIGQIVARAEDLRQVAASQPHDRAFPAFARRALDAGGLVEIVSDGFGFYIAAALEALGVGDLPIVTASTTFTPDGRVSVAFPNGHPACFVCGTSKRNRVLAHQAAGRAVVFIGDGHSDRYAAGYADVVFAKDDLLELCRARGWPCNVWQDFGALDAWLAVSLDAWERDPASMPAPRGRPFFCGPEVWGEGRTAPPKPVRQGEGLVPG
jgi:2,3-diketo-5-methylthio-1-phosphopentane phosphatase